MSKTTPIIGREALLSLIDWVQTIRRQQDERAISGDSGEQDTHPGGTHASDYTVVDADDSPAAHNERQRLKGACVEEGA